MHTTRAIALRYAGMIVLYAVCMYNLRFVYKACGGNERARVLCCMGLNAVVRAACTTRTPGQRHVFQTGGNRKAVQSMGTNRASL